jgi:hypothetical protein
MINMTLPNIPLATRIAVCVESLTNRQITIHEAGAGVVGAANALRLAGNALLESRGYSLPTTATACVTVVAGAMSMVSS